jgi:hypothetical protein
MARTFTDLNQSVSALANTTACLLLEEKAINIYTKSITYGNGEDSKVSVLSKQID